MLEEEYDVVFVHDPQPAPIPALRGKGKSLWIWRYHIDTSSPKNLHLQEAVARQVLGWLGVRLDTPLITQVSRFDPWKDPLGVIRAYRMVRNHIPDLQLALVGSMALDDPEGWEIYQGKIWPCRLRGFVERDSGSSGGGDRWLTAWEVIW